MIKSKINAQNKGKKGKNSNKKGVIWRILGYCKPYKFLGVFSVVSAILNVAFALLAPVFVGRAIDYIIGEGNVEFKNVLVYLCLVLACVLGSAVFNYTMTVCTQKIATFSARDFRLDAFKKLNRVPIAFIDRANHGDVISRFVNDADKVADGLNQALTQFLPGAVTIIGTLIVMFVLNPLIAAVVVLITPLSIFLAVFVAKMSRQSFLSKAKTEGEISGFINEMVTNQTLIKTFGNEEKTEKEFSVLTDELFKTGVKAQFYSAISNPSTRFVNGVVYAAVCVIGAFSVMGKTLVVLTVGQMSCFLTYANQYTKPFNEISGVITELQTAIVSAKRLFEIVDAQPETEDDENSVSITNCKGNIEIKNVDFSYLPAKPLIKNFNLDVKSGQKIAIVGPTGCGKTTLINLLMRFYDVTGGEISVDGVPITKIKRCDLRSLYGMVLQETWLQEATVRENIAYANKNATDEQVVAAAKAAFAHGFIMRLAKGYDTVICADGGSLSAGEKQLLCIARIMLAKPEMLILDEATSSIDTRTEILINRAFNKLMKNRTTFVVAHRLSTIQTADVILVMNNGNIVEKGSHTQLLSQNGFYAKLYNSQFVSK